MKEVSEVVTFQKSQEKLVPRAKEKPEIASPTSSENRKLEAIG